MELINGILDLSKIESGKMEIKLESFEIQDVIQASVQTIKPMLQKNKNTLKIEFDESLGYMVADRLRPACDRNQAPRSGHIPQKRHRSCAQSTGWKSRGFREFPE